MDRSVSAPSDFYQSSKLLTTANSVCRRWVLFAAAWALLCAVILLTNENYRWNRSRDSVYGADFVQEWVGARIISGTDSDQLYSRQHFRAVQHDDSLLGFSWPEDSYFPPVYPPTHYALFMPLSHLSYRHAVTVWILLSMLCYPAAVAVIERQTSASPVAPWFWGLALLFPAVISTWTMGQKGFVWLLIAAVTRQQWCRGKEFRAGMWWGLAAVKPTLFFLLPVAMLINRKWSFAAGATFSCLGLLGITLMMVPAGLWFEYADVVLGAGKYQEHGGYQAAWSASLWTWLQPSGSFGKVAGVSAAAVILMSLRTRSDNGLRSGHWLLKVLTATCLLSPHFYFYDLVILLLPLRLCLTEAPRQTCISVVALWCCVAVVSAESGWQHGMALLPVGLLIAHLSARRFEATTCANRVASAGRFIRRTSADSTGPEMNDVHPVHASA